MDKKSGNCSTTTQKGAEPSRTIGYKDSYKITGKAESGKASK
ncbi:hypothetical protein [Paenibacillus sp. FSL R7-0337]|nr:hypothetical protein [Paenibacillus sp. FSL R7-0337]